MPQPPFFIKDGKGFYLHFNGWDIPSIKDLKQMVSLLEVYINKGQEWIDKENILIEKERDKQYEEDCLSQQKDRVKQKKTGYIYLIKSENLYKIGRTKNLDSRITAYKTENPYEIELLHSFFCDDYIDVEKKVLKEFSNKRIGTREWCNLSEDDVKKFRELEKIYG